MILHLPLKVGKHLLLLRNLPSLINKAFIYSSLFIGHSEYLSCASKCAGSWKTWKWISHDCYTLLFIIWEIGSAEKQICEQYYHNSEGYTISVFIKHNAGTKKQIINDPLRRNGAWSRRTSQRKHGKRPSLKGWVWNIQINKVEWGDHRLRIPSLLYTVNPFISHYVRILNNLYSLEEYLVHCLWLSELV